MVMVSYLHYTSGSVIRWSGSSRTVKQYIRLPWCAEQTQKELWKDAGQAWSAGMKPHPPPPSSPSLFSSSVLFLCYTEDKAEKTLTNRPRQAWVCWMQGSSCHSALDLCRMEKQIGFDVSLEPVPDKTNMSY